jgi:hypothetical protein
LKPAPVSRFRGAYPHQLCSYALQQPVPLSLCSWHTIIRIADEIHTGRFTSEGGERSTRRELLLQEPVSVGDGMATGLADNTSSLDESQLRGRRGFLHLPDWSRIRTGNWDRYAIAKNQRDGDPALMHVQPCPALGEPDQGLIVYAVKLRERRQVFEPLARDTQGLFRDVNLGWLQRRFPCPIRRPGSGELVEINFPCESRVVPKRSLVRPVISFCSSLTTLDESLYPVVTEPMILRLPSRMKSFFSILMVASNHSSTAESVKLAGFYQISLVITPD